MNGHLRLASLAVLWAFGTGGASPVHAAFTTTGTYDENTANGNVVDVSATSDTGVEISLASFTALVGLAYQADAGGVINFDSGSLTDANTIDATVGVSAAKSITITDGTTGTLQINTPVFNAISGNAALRKTPGGFTFTRNDYIFDFNPGDGIVAVGASIMSQFTLGSPVGNVTGLVRYDDASVSPFVTSFISHSISGDDTFWGFQAPAGRSIVRLELIISNDVDANLDDLAFVMEFKRPPVTGDLDGDGFVGINDLDIVLNVWNQQVRDNHPADPTGDNFVGIDDLDIVLGNWNGGIPPTSGSLAPEPGTCATLLVLSALLCERKTRVSRKCTRVHANAHQPGPD